MMKDETMKHARNALDNSQLHVTSERLCCLSIIIIINMHYYLFVTQLVHFCSCGAMLQAQSREDAAGVAFIPSVSKSPKRYLLFLSHSELFTPLLCLKSGPFAQPKQTGLCQNFVIVPAESELNQSRPF